MRQLFNFAICGFRKFSQSQLFKRERSYSTDFWAFKGVWVILFLVQNSWVQAQMNGWPNSGHGSATITTNQTWCTDRARVTAMTSGTTTRTLTLENFEGSFTQGDWVMVIQMYQLNGIGGKGRYTMCEVSSTGTISSPSTTIEVKPYTDNTYTNVWPAFVLNDPTDDLVQIVKIQRYWDLTINGGIITCPAFDFSKGTGGILCVVVGNDFTMNGGYLNVHAKGFHTVFNSSTGSLGKGGAGALAASSHLPLGQCLGSNPASVDRNINPSYTFWLPGMINFNGEPGGILRVKAGVSDKFYLGFTGQTGGLANNPNTSGSKTSAYRWFLSPHSDYTIHDLHLGCPGKYGDNSGSGGGGGGFGGNGGNTISLKGQTGEKGQDGKPGGNAGQSGVGGGILYIKVANSYLNFANYQSRFIASGSNGGNGGNGGDGGLGGRGGIGGDGQCNNMNLLAPGGIGGYGDGGLGGDGGDAGDGACGGTLWFLKKANGNHSLFGVYMNNLAGKPGKGGAPGYQYSVTRVPRPVNFSTPLNALPCNPNQNFSYTSHYSYCPPVVCDCDEVFRHLGQDIGNIITYTRLGNSQRRINSIATPAEPPVYWDGTGILSYTKVNGSCTTKYECKMKSNARFVKFMDKVFGDESLDSYDGNGSLFAGLEMVDWSNGKTRLYSQNAHLMYEYDQNLKTLTDYDDLTNPYVDVDVCVMTTDVISGAVNYQGAYNGTGEFPKLDDTPIVGLPNGNRGSDASGRDQWSGNYFESEEVQGPSIENYFEGLDIQVLQNRIEIVNPNKLDGQIQICNIMGQVLYTGNLNNDVNMLNLSSGVYIIYLVSNVHVQQSKIIIHE